MAILLASKLAPEWSSMLCINWAAITGSAIVFRSDKPCSSILRKLPLLSRLALVRICFLDCSVILFLLLLLSMINYYTQLYPITNSFHNKCAKKNAPNQLRPDAFPTSTRRFYYFVLLNIRLLCLLDGTHLASSCKSIHQLYSHSISY